MRIQQDLLEKVVKLAKEVGRFQLKYFRQVGDSSVDMKAAKETVSFVDVESEKLLFEGLTDLVEGAGFFGEESGKSGSQQLVWIVDPLDGTTNYLSGIDHFSVSIALVKDGEPLLGLIYQPYKDEYFAAIKGEGMLYNGKAVKPFFSEVDANQALFITGFPYRSEDVQEQFFIAAKNVLKLGRGIRRSGSAALDLAYLSAGWYHGFWETDLQPYDCAAALLMMKENGMQFSNGKGESFNMFEDRLLVAAAPQVYSSLLKAVQLGYGELN